MWGMHSRLSALHLTRNSDIFRSISERARVNLSRSTFYVFIWRRGANPLHYVRPSLPEIPLETGREDEARTKAFIKLAGNITSG